MSLSEADIERIVREVLRRLAAMMPQPPVAARSSTLKIDSRLITTASLIGKLEGIQRVELPSRVVITPAARDYLRECGVQWVKQGS